MVEEIKKLITGVLYSEISDEIGPNPVLWLPESVSEHIRMLISIKVSTILTGEEEFKFKDMFIMPFPSLGSKALIKFIEWKDPNRRGGIGRSNVVILFKEFDDLIFYQYKDDLKPLYQAFAEVTIEYEMKELEKAIFAEELNKFYDNVVSLLAKLKAQEVSEIKGEEFPDKEEEKPDYEYRFKIVVAGDPGVGKTSSILRFTRNAFTRTYLPTLGTSISEKTLSIQMDDRAYNVQLILWDIAGQEKFSSMRRHFYQGVDGAFLVFDLTDFKSFNSIYNWHKDITDNWKKNYPLIGIMVGNKRDLTDERQIEQDAASQLANELGLHYMETSALTGENVENAFYEIAKSLLLKNK